MRLVARLAAALSGATPGLEQVMAALLRHCREHVGTLRAAYSVPVTTGSSLVPLLEFPRANLVGVLAFAALSTDPMDRIEKQYRLRPRWLVPATWSQHERSTCPLCIEGSEPLMPASEFN